MTPGLGVNAIAKAARMRKEDVPIVIAKAAEGGLIVPDGGRSPKWRVNQPLFDWANKALADVASLP